MPRLHPPALGTLFLAGSLLLGGCSGALLIQPTTPRGHATLVLEPELSGRARPRTQAVVPHLTRDDVHHVRLLLNRVTPDGYATVEGKEGPIGLSVDRSELDRPIVLSQLSPHAHYRIRAWAFGAADELPEHLLSQDGSLDVVVGDDDRPTVAPLRIQLKDVPFDGRASLPSIEVLPGGYAPSGPESIDPAWPDYVPTDLGFVWAGLDGDRVGRRSAEPDGLADAHLQLTIDLPAGVTVRYVSLYAFDAFGEYVLGQYWTTWDYGEASDRLLAVAHDGQLINSGFVSQLGTFSGPTSFDLYAHSDGDFSPGATYSLDVGLSNDTVLIQDVTIPASQEVNP